MKTAKKKNNRCRVSATLCEGIDRERWAGLCRDIGSLPGETFNYLTQRLEDHVFLDNMVNGSGAKTKKNLAVSRVKKADSKGAEIFNSVHIESLREYMANVSITTAVAALMLQELLCRNNDKLGQEIVDLYWERIGKMGNSDVGELADDGLGLFVLGLLQGVSLSGSVDMYRPQIMVG